MPEISSYHAEALALHQRHTVVDGHADTLTLVVDEGHPFAEGGSMFHIDVPRLRQAGMGIQTLTCWNEPERIGKDAFARAMEKIGAFYQEQRKGKLRQVRTKADLDVRELGFMLSLEDAAPCMGSPRHLEALYAAGVRMIGLTWNGRNEIADGVKVSDRPSGLTRIGEAMVSYMQDLGIVVDLSHIAEPGFWDVLEISRKPLVCSHSNAKAVHDHVRNLTDAQIKAIAAQGGVIGVCFAPSFLDPTTPDIEAVVRHIDHMCALAGPDVVGLGSDFDGIAEVPKGLEDVTRLPDLTAALLKRGYQEADLAKILGGNWLRVLRANFAE
ncbi:MAG TPA: dipeptidase [Oscillatoriaceae cyanobacterium]